MKKNKPTDRKRTFTICGLSALCVAVLAGAWLLTREPEREFIPASTEASGGTDLIVFPDSEQVFIAILIGKHNVMAVPEKPQPDIRADALQHKVGLSFDLKTKGNHPDPGHGLRQYPDGGFRG